MPTTRQLERCQAWTRRRLLAAGLLAMISQLGVATAAAATSSGTHFIVLFDDSHDMTSFQEAAAHKLVEQLYRPPGNGQLPFQPASDRVSLLFFAIHTGDHPGDVCKPQRHYSAMPEFMFAPEALSSADVANREAFAAALARARSRPCRWQGNLSPIASAPALAFYYLQGKLASKELFARTFILEATNDSYNTTASPALELERSQGLASDERAGRTLRDVRHVEDLVGSFSSYFQLNLLPDRDDSPQQEDSSKTARKRDYVHVFELRPLGPPPASRLTYGREIVLDRLARSSRDVVLAPQEPERADLWIELPRQVSAAGSGQLAPLTLTWSIAAAAGGPWRPDDAVFPAAEQRLDLERCPAPCRREGDHLVVPLMALAPSPRIPIAHETPASEGRLRFRVAFRYVTSGRDAVAVADRTRALAATAQGSATPAYDAAFLESPVQEVRLTVAPPLPVPGAVFFPAFGLTSGELVRRWRPGDTQGPDGGLRPAVARERVLARRDNLQLLILIGSVVGIATLVGLLLLHFYRTAYRRPFRPQLEWRPEPELVLDFSRPSSGHLLAGTFRVVNSEPVPWFGTYLGNQEQPTRQAAITIELPPLHTAGLELTEGPEPAFGLLRQQAAGATGDGAKLGLSTEEAVGDGKLIPVFLAAERISDLTPAAAAELRDFLASFVFGVRIEWTPLVRQEPGALTQRAAFALRVRPEAAQPPRITFAAARPPELFFHRGARPEAGRFVFASTASHGFALPWNGDYVIAAARDGAPLAGQPFHLPAQQVTVGARQTLRVPVVLDCDGEVVGNPNPASQLYEIRLLGPRAASSEPGPHPILLRRDPTRAEIELEVGHLDQRHEVFWTAEGPRQRQRSAAGLAAGAGSPIDGGRLELESFPLSFTEGQEEIDLLSLRIGNSGSSGRGIVEVDVRPRLWLAADSAAQLQLRSGRRPEDVLRLNRRTETSSQPLASPAHPVIREGEAPWQLDLLFVPSQIESIGGARIAPEDCHAEVALEILVRDDQGRTSRRQLTVSVPLALERQPGPSWLCIDFGTSAIAAARGNGTYSGFQMIDLQRAPMNLKDASITFATEDLENAEQATPFLPSSVICDADLRTDPPAPGKDGWRPGYPAYRPASLQPGDASFVGLPATSTQLRDERNSRRVVVSLKSWLGSGASEIRLGEKVSYRQQGKPIHDYRLQVDAVVESGFAALAEAYLSDVRSEQLVICHPNTFTVHHRERLHTAAANALMRPLGIASPAHIRLLSESDAVAFSHCIRAMREAPRGCSERILVYDFGAGTLDLSLVHVEWNLDPCYPRRWTVEARLGVAVAGNYLDELLARQVHELLRDPAVMRRQQLVYARPIVTRKRPGKEEMPQYRVAILALAAAIREAKHGWDGQGPLEIRVGSLQTRAGVIERDQQAAPDATLLPSAPESGSATLRIDGDDVWLSIPAPRVEGHPRMEELMQFVTGTVVDEALDAAGLATSDVRTLLVSGRGALWPLLRPRLLARFPQAEKPDWLDSGTSMKEAVVHGAITWQDLLWAPIDDAAARRGAHLGVLLGEGNDIVMEEQWGSGSPIDLTAFSSFRLVEVGLKVPDPRRDRSSLRRHFYHQLSPHRYDRATLWKDDPWLFVDKTPQGEVLLRNRRGQTMRTDGSGSIPVPMTPPWPVGQLVLDPLDGEGER